MKLLLKDYKLPKDLEAYKKAVKEFTRTELEDCAVEMQKTNKLPKRLIPLLADAGLLALRIPKEYGGSGLTFTEYWPILAEVARSAGTIRMFVHGYNGIWLIIGKNGNEEQKRKYLPMFVDGSIGFPGFALTEPGTGTGVDIKTTAKKEGKFYKLNGKKHLITFADIAAITHTVVYTGDRSLGAKGTSIILVEKGAPGLTLVPHEDMIGIAGCYHAVQVFENCTVPEKNLVGKEGNGLNIAMHFLDPSRLSIGVSCLGPAERILDIAVDYAKKRVTFGKPIEDRQAVQQMLADMATDIYALKCMIGDCGKMYDNGESIAATASMVKLFGIETTRKVSDLALIIHGGIGCTAEYPLQRHYRDVRCLWFEEGTPTIQRLVIGRDVLGKQVRQVGK